jgi:hypothetical protein
VNDTCPTHLRLYPSQTMEDDYITSNPMLFTIGAVLIFVFTSATFLLYDWMVERRQQKVMATAAQSSAIVSSLFPSTVLDRLFPSGNGNTESFKHAHGLESLLFNGFGGGGTSRPIADLYPSSSVMFADM